MADILQLYSRETLHSVSAPTLAGADLSGVDLRYGDLRGQDLRGANLREACLYGADLSEANLSGADLTGADIFLAHFHGADLRGARLCDTRLEMAEFGRAKVDLHTEGVNGETAARLGMVMEVDLAGIAEVGAAAPASRPLAPVPGVPNRPVPVPSGQPAEPIFRRLSPDRSRLIARSADRKDRKRWEFLTVLTVGRTSAVILAMGTLAYILTPPSVLSSLRLHENPTLLYMVGYYVLLCLGAYALAAPLRSRWHRDSGLPY